MTAEIASPHQQLQWLHALLAWDQEERWLLPHCRDDQFRALVLAYAMKELRADAVKDLSTSGTWESGEKDAPLRSFWVYGFEVATPQPVFVGVYGEADRREAEVAAAARHAGRAVPVPWSHSRWEDAKPHAFETLEHARRFYSRETFSQMHHLSGLAAAHIRAQALVMETPPATAPKAPLARL